LEQSLAFYQQLDIEILIPGHGDPLFGRAEVQRWLSELRRYLQRVRSKVQKHLQTEDDTQRILDEVQFDEFVPGALAKAEYDMEKRHRDTVAKIIQEER
jgi:hypothetical protein